MGVGIGWLGVGIGIVGCIATYLMAGGGGASAEPTAGKRRIYLAAGLNLLIAIIVWAVSMQKREPFSPGQTLGWGLLIGGIAGSLAGLLSFRLASFNASVRQRQLSVYSVLFFSLFAVSLTYSIFHGNPYWALIGFSMGTVMAAILMRYLPDADADFGIYTEMWAVFGISIAAGIILAVNHFDQQSLRTWWSLPILLGVTVLLASFVGTELGSLGRLRERAGLRSPISVLLVIGLTAVYSWKVVGDWRLLGVVIAGIVSAAIIAWIAGVRSRSEDRSYGLEAASASVLLVVAFIVASFTLWAGLGIALGLIAAWTVALQYADSTETSPKPESYALRGMLALGLIILLFKLFVQLYQPEIGSLDLRIHYTFIGALLGIILPFAVISNLTKLNRAENADIRLLAGIAAIGLLVAVAPILLHLVWGIKVVMGFLFGLTASAAVLLLLRLSGECDGGGLCGYPIWLPAIGAQLSAIEFERHLVDFDLTRAVRIWILSAVFLVAALWFIFAGITAARRSRQGGR